MNKTHIPGVRVITHEQRVDTYIDGGPKIFRPSRYSDKSTDMHISRVVTIYKRREIQGETGDWAVDHRIYARTTLKDGTPSNTEQSIKDYEWTHEVETLVDAIVDETWPDEAMPA